MTERIKWERVLPPLNLVMWVNIFFCLSKCKPKRYPNLFWWTKNWNNRMLEIYKQWTTIYTSRILFSIKATTLESIVFEWMICSMEMVNFIGPQQMESIDLWTSIDIFITVKIWIGSFTINQTIQIFSFYLTSLHRCLRSDQK